MSIYSARVDLVLTTILIPKMQMLSEDLILLSSTSTDAEDLKEVKGQLQYCTLIYDFLIEYSIGNEEFTESEIYSILRLVGSAPGGSGFSTSLNSSATAPGNGGGSGGGGGDDYPTLFTDLLDTPDIYAEGGGKLVYVKEGEDGLDFSDIKLEDIATKQQARTSEDITATVKVGAIEIGDVLPAFTDIDGLAHALLEYVYPPIILSDVYVTAEGVTAAYVEVGTDISGTVTSSLYKGTIQDGYTPGDTPGNITDLKGLQTSSSFSYVGVGVGTTDPDTGVYSYQAGIGSNKWAAFIGYDTGTSSYYDSAGDVSDILDYARATDVSTGYSSIITGVRALFLGTGVSVPTGSAEIRTLTSKLITTDTFELSVPANTKYSFFALPVGYTVMVYHEESFDNPIQNEYVHNIIEVDDAAGVSQTFELWYLDIGAGYSEVQTHRIVLT